MTREVYASARLTFRFQSTGLWKVLARLMQSEKSFLSIETPSVSPLSFYCLCLFWVPAKIKWLIVQWWTRHLIGRKKENLAFLLCSWCLILLYWSSFCYKNLRGEFISPHFWPPFNGLLIISFFSPCSHESLWYSFLSWPLSQDFFPSHHSLSDPTEWFSTLHSTLALPPCGLGQVITP